MEGGRCVLGGGREVGERGGTDVGQKGVELRVMCRLFFLMHRIHSFLACTKLSDYKSEYYI